MSETLLDAAITEGEYAGIDTHKIKRVKKDVKLTLPINPKMPTYPESFVAWYKHHDMTAGMKAALQGAGWSEEDINYCKTRFIKKYGVSVGYKICYLGEALLEDDKPGAWGLADLIVTAPPQAAQPGVPMQGSRIDRY